MKLKGEMKLLNVQNKSLHAIGFMNMLSSGLGKCVRSELAVGSFVYIQDRKKIHRFLHFPNGKVRQKTLNLVECFIERVWQSFSENACGQPSNLLRLSIPLRSSLKLEIFFQHFNLLFFFAIYSFKQIPSRLNLTSTVFTI